MIGVSRFADKLSQNVGKLYKSSASVESDVSSLYNNAITIDSGPIESGTTVAAGGDPIDVANVEPSNLASTDFTHALQLVSTTNDSGDSILCVRQGTIDNIIPTISGTALEPDFKENELSTPGTGTRQYWLNITVEDGEATAVAIEESEPGDDSETQAKLLLGSVETNSGDVTSVNSNLSGSQSFASCGAVHFFGLI